MERPAGKLRENRVAAVAFLWSPKWQMDFLLRKLWRSGHLAHTTHYYPTVYALYLYYIQKYANNQLRNLKETNDDKA